MEEFKKVEYNAGSEVISTILYLLFSNLLKATTIICINIFIIKLLAVMSVSTTPEESSNEDSIKNTTDTIAPLFINNIKFELPASATFEEVPDLVNNDDKWTLDRETTFKHEKRRNHEKTSLPTLVVQNAHKTINLSNDPSEWPPLPTPVITSIDPSKWPQLPIPPITSIYQFELSPIPFQSLDKDLELPTDISSPLLINNEKFELHAIDNSGILEKDLDKVTIEVPIDAVSPLFVNSGEFELPAINTKVTLEKSSCKDTTENPTGSSSTVFIDSGKFELPAFTSVILEKCSCADTIEVSIDTVSTLIINHGESGLPYFIACGTLGKSSGKVNTEVSIDPISSVFINSVQCDIFATSSEKNIFDKIYRINNVSFKDNSDVIIYNTEYDSSNKLLVFELEIDIGWKTDLITVYKNKIILAREQCNAFEHKEIENPSKKSLPDSINNKDKWTSDRENIFKHEDRRNHEKTSLPRSVVQHMHKTINLSKDPSEWPPLPTPVITLIDPSKWPQHPIPSIYQFELPPTPIPFFRSLGKDIIEVPTDTISPLLINNGKFELPAIENSVTLEKGPDKDIIEVPTDTLSPLLVNSVDFALPAVNTKVALEKIPSQDTTKEPTASTSSVFINNGKFEIPISTSVILEESSCAGTIEVSIDTVSTLIINHGESELPYFIACGTLEKSSGKVNTEVSIDPISSVFINSIQYDLFATSSEKNIFDKIYLINNVSFKVNSDVTTRNYVYNTEYDSSNKFLEFVLEIVIEWKNDLITEYKNEMISARGQRNVFEHKEIKCLSKNSPSDLVNDEDKWIPVRENTFNHEERRNHENVSHPTSVDYHAHKTINLSKDPSEWPPLPTPVITSIDPSKWPQHPIPPITSIYQFELPPIPIPLFQSLGKDIEMPTDNTSPLLISNCKFDVPVINNSTTLEKGPDKDTIEGPSDTLSPLFVNSGEFELPTINTKVTIEKSPSKDTTEMSTGSTPSVFINNCKFELAALTSTILEEKSYADTIEVAIDAVSTLFISHSESELPDFIACGNLEKSSDKVNIEVSIDPISSVFMNNVQYDICATITEKNIFDKIYRINNVLFKYDSDVIIYYTEYDSSNKMVEFELEIDIEWRNDLITENKNKIISVQGQYNTFEQNEIECLSKNSLPDLVNDEDNWIPVRENTFNREERRNHENISLPTSSDHHAHKTINLSKDPSDWPPLPKSVITSIDPSKWPYLPMPSITSIYQFLWPPFLTPLIAIDPFKWSPFPLPFITPTEPSEGYPLPTSFIAPNNQYEWPTIQTPLISTVGQFEWPSVQTPHISTVGQFERPPLQTTLNINYGSFTLPYIHYYS